MLYKILLVYLICINLIAVVCTAYDKYAAKNKKWRISEKALLIVSLLGGSVSMLVMMYLIRHKTRKMKFMIGIPLIILVQLLAVIFVLVNL